MGRYEKVRSLVLMTPVYLWQLYNIFVNNYLSSG